MRAENTGVFNFYHIPELPGLELVKGMNVTHSFPRHAHHNYCIGIIDQGCRSYQSNGTTNYISAGGTLWINPGEVHTSNSADKKRHSFRMLCLEPDYLLKLLSDGLIIMKDSPFLFKTNITDDIAVYKILAALFNLLEKSESALEKENKLLNTLATLLQERGCITTFPKIDESKAIALAREYLEMNYMNNVSIEKLSQFAGLSTYHFIRLFGKKVGLSPHNFLAQIRIKQAKIKLNHGESIINVALETGFTDQSHLTRVFKRIVGLTPGEYVKNQTN